ncbi:GDSL esterase/lipase At5g55050-like [Phoenix dactylifera]|uniref:GDSL esterase/lipase At5g55050-like n=1 Tax=Phoenix dactylifera TaxID=42345 RepID=A0A8B7BJJ4_PHODC|nr:GDSL esterase/lipase At5g55050-like [Phoenix dactylifera]
MGFVNKRFLPRSLHLFLLFDLLLNTAGGEAAKVPAIYVFGDSTADVGNNNYLPENSPKANFPHNGIDFPFSRPTGRFSNGYNAIDFFAIHMGFRRSPPPSLSLSNKTNHQIMRGLKGVNFASGGSGIALDSMGSTITMTKQIQNFAMIKSNITARIGSKTADHLLSKSIFLISTGGNDIFAYYSQMNSPNNTGEELFVTTLVSKYGDHVKELYTLGARKFGVVDVPPIGCCPYSRSFNATGGCIDKMNELALGFNNAVRALMRNLRLTLKGMKYSIGSSYEVVLSIMKNSEALGYKEIKTACCGAGKFNARTGCTPNATYCSVRHHYLFWDMLHPTHMTSKLASLAIYHGSQNFATPINFKQLVEDEV